MLTANQQAGIILNCERDHQTCLAGRHHFPQLTCCARGPWRASARWEWIRAPTLNDTAQCHISGTKKRLSSAPYQGSDNNRLFTQSHLALGFK